MFGVVLDERKPLPEPPLWPADGPRHAAAAAAAAAGVNDPHGWFRTSVLFLKLRVVSFCLTPFRRVWELGMPSCLRFAVVLSSARGRFFWVLFTNPVG